MEKETLQPSPEELRGWLINSLVASFQDRRNHKENDLRQEHAGHLGESVEASAGCKGEDGNQRAGM